MHPKEILLRLGHAVLEGQIAFAQLLFHVLGLAVVHHFEAVQRNLKINRLFYSIRNIITAEPFSNNLEPIMGEKVPRRSGISRTNLTTNHSS